MIFTCEEHRIAEVAKLRLSGYTAPRQIAERLGISVRQAMIDSRTLDMHFLESATRDITLAKGLDLERTDRLMQVYYPDAIAGNLKCAQFVMDLLDYRMKSLGIAAAQKINLEAQIRVLAKTFGMDPEEAIAEAQTIIANGVR